MERVPSEHQETFCFYYEGDQAPAKVAHAGCGVLGDIQKPTGHHPGQTALYVALPR